MHLNKALDEIKRVAEGPSSGKLSLTWEETKFLWVELTCLREELKALKPPGKGPLPTHTTPKS